MERPFVLRAHVAIRPLGDISAYQYLQLGPLVGPLRKGLDCGGQTAALLGTPRHCPSGPPLNDQLLSSTEAPAQGLCLWLSWGCRAELVCGSGRGHRGQREKQSAGKIAGSLVSVPRDGVLAPSAL